MEEAIQEGISRDIPNSRVQTYDCCTCLAATVCSLAVNVILKTLTPEHYLKIDLHYIVCVSQAVEESMNCEHFIDVWFPFTLYQISP